MLSKRIIACLDVRDGHVVKGVKFEGLRTAGDPAELARRYNQEGIDELVILDVTATLERRRALADTIHAVARELFIPLAVGGGIRTDSGGGVGRRWRPCRLRRGLHAWSSRCRARRIHFSLCRKERADAEAVFARTWCAGAPVLIPSIDLQGGAVVQLVQGERLAIKDD